MKYNDISNIIENVIRQERNSDEMRSHDIINSTSLMHLLDEQDYKKVLVNNYFLGNKEVHKVKRLEPSKKIIDADDINWDGFKIQFGGKTYKPHTTIELLDLIFRLFQRVFDSLGADDVVWNDAGANRDDNRYRLNWGDPVNIEIDDNGNEIYFDINSSMKEWEPVKEITE